MQLSGTTIIRVTTKVIGLVFALALLTLLAFVLLRHQFVVLGIVAIYSIPFVAGILVRTPLDLPLWTAIATGASIPFLYVWTYWQWEPNYHFHKLPLGVVLYSVASLMGWILSDEFIKKRTA